MDYPTLFSPMKIGAMQVKNRIVMTAMGTRTAAEDGTPAARCLAYFEERAKNDVGLIITGMACANYQHGNAGPGQLRLDNDGVIPGMQKLTEMAHSHGAKIVAQVAHPGARSNTAVTGGAPILTPSGIPAWPGAPGQEARAMTREEILGLAEDFGAAAKRARQAGFDGVEFHAAHNYLLSNFLSPHFNRREDEYGGSLENRFRFLGHIIAAARAAAGENFPILVRISAEEYLPDGLHLDEALQVAVLLEKAGAAAIDVSVGGAVNGRSHTIEPTSYPQGWRRAHAKAIKQLVTVPVIATTVIRQPAYAEVLLREGYMDFVGSGRNFLADPAWAKKAAAGKDADIRPCISCCRCIEGTGMPHIGCSINPECGWELEFAAPPARADGKTAAVVGAGPAGMEAAAVLAQRGYAVTVYEENPVAGGQVQLATAIATKREKMQNYIDWQARRLVALGVDVRFGTKATAEVLATQKPDVVVDAAGAVPIVPAALPGSGLPHVKTPVDVLRGTWAPEGQFIVLVGSGLTGLETAEVLVDAGNMVLVLEMADTVAPGGSAINTGEAMRRLNLANVVVLTSRRLTEIQEGRVLCEDTQTGAKFTIPCDGVVLSLGVAASPALGEDAAAVPAGDAACPARILEATAGGYRVAREL